MINGTRKTRILLLAAGLLVLLCCAGTVSAYSFDFITPDPQTATLKMGVGSQIVVECVTDASLAGTTKRIVLKKSGTSSGTVDSKSVVIQSNGHFGTTFDTWDLKGGMYTVTVEDPGEDFGSKRTFFTVQLVDRTSELTSTSPRVQYSTTDVEVSGKASETGAKGVELTMYEGSVVDGRVVYGPYWVGTDANGQFSEVLPATGAGMYQVAVRDKDGYIGLLTYTLMSGSPTSSVTATATQTSSGQTLTANAVASKAKPAYFAIKTGTGTSTITAFRGTDWTLEYTVNGGTPIKVNEKDENSDESFTVTTSDANVNLMVYPSSGDASATVYISAKNVVSLAADPNLANTFGKPGADPSATESPVGIILPFLGVLAAAGIVRMRRT
ncbi:hypothetical protein [Methanorbis furvi]|uniref:Uncharacterized protein n=1 Tax=Methanorbis furvi TaxID=3028299 RepID=A0AAE4S8Z3_9EURY|nr:hypothetical protein [Methanocorpusculaceae archaeon Ag1]